MSALQSFPPTTGGSIARSSANPIFSKNLELVERLKKVAARYGRTPGEVAIAWTLRLPAVTGAIVGARNARQAEGVMRAGELKLTPQDIAEIEGTTAAHAGC